MKQLTKPDQISTADAHSPQLYQRSHFGKLTAPRRNILLLLLQYSTRYSGNIGIKQEQFAVKLLAHCFSAIQFHPDNSVAVQSVDCGEAVRQQLNRELLLFYTDVTRIADGVLQEQQQNIPVRRGELAEMAALVEPGLGRRYGVGVRIASASR